MPKHSLPPSSFSLSLSILFIQTSLSVLSLDSFAVRRSRRVPLDFMESSLSINELFSHFKEKFMQIVF